MFRSQRAEILLFPVDGEPGMHCSLDGEGRIETNRPVALSSTEGVWARVASEARAVLLPRPMANERLREHFQRQGIRDAMVAPIFGHDAVVGTLLVGNRDSDVSTFGPEDLKLFETLANHASAAIENGRLIDRLRRQAEEREHQALHDALTGLPNRDLFRRSWKPRSAGQPSPAATSRSCSWTWTASRR